MAFQDLCVEGPECIVSVAAGPKSANSSAPYRDLGRLVTCTRVRSSKIRKRTSCRRRRHGPRLLGGLLSAVEADQRFEWLELGCSVANGRGDELSDLDLGL